MTVPGRGLACDHVQPFDLREFLLTNLLTLGTLHGPCPVCNAELSDMDLAGSPFFEAILAATAPQDEAVEVFGSGRWKVHRPAATRNG